MANGRSNSSTPPAKVEDELKDMKLENSEGDGLAGTKIENGHNVSTTHTNSSSRFPTKREESPESLSDGKELLGGDITVKVEPGQQTPKLVRSSTQKVKSRAPPTYEHLPDATSEATGSFQVITQCTYTPKYLGDTEHAMECDCAEEWDAAAKANRACGEDSDCINRATKMECVGDCGCGALCENQRFQRQQFANVSVIKTEMKGHGLRTDSDLQAGEFIFEYIGEVINENQFRKRMIQYDEEGIKHFYFMSLSRGEFVDATKRGNLGRFCNHSCNPNCYVDKWVIGDKLRMGIFAERKIRAGEELVFNYNVDRYGADPQPCYCGEPNCTGVIGGKTQTERATKLSHTTIEALGIDDGDGWDTAVAKRPRKKKVGEDDEEYVNNVQPKSLDEDSVTKVMATLMQCKEKWIAVKLLGRIQRCEEERVIARVVKMHGYQILNSTLTTWKEDFNVVLQVLQILDRFPRLTKNKITDSKIEGTVENLQQCGDERVESQATALLQEWSILETAYRIPRKKRDPNATDERQSRTERRDDRDGKSRRSRSRSKERSRSRSKSLDAPRGPSSASIPTGPRGSQPQRAFFGNNRPPYRAQRSFAPLPAGWFTATSEDGRVYFYNTKGETRWQRPTAPAVEPPPPPKPDAKNRALEALINDIVANKTKTPDLPTSSTTPKPGAEESKPAKKEGQEKWRTYSLEKQKKVYENTLFVPIKAVADKYKHKLPREDLKRFFKEVLKKLVNSDYKNNRVQDPTVLSEKQEKQVRSFTKSYFEKAVAKRPAQDKKKTDAGRRKDPNGSSKDDKKQEDESDKDGVMDASDDGQTQDGPTDSATPITPLDSSMASDVLKRKRADGDNELSLEEESATPSKRARSITPPGPPPPPPPPPADLPSVEGAEDQDNDLVSTSNSYDVTYRSGSALVLGEDGVVGESTDGMEDLRHSTVEYVEGQHAS